MPEIPAEGIEISIENEQWRLFNMTGPNSLTPFFSVLRGDGVLHYTPAFAEARGLPGDVLSVDYVKAVIVGFDERRRRWTLGLHVAIAADQKPRFVELAHWPSDQNPQYAVDSHTAGRVLAEYMSCPLKLFGVKKPIQAPGTFNPRATVTGPLTPHERVDMNHQEVQFHAQQIELPLSRNDIWLGTVQNNNLTLRLPREATDKNKGEVPAYNQVVFDKNAQTVRLVPPTGLLGAFFGPQGRMIKFPEIRNVELRHVMSHESSLKKGDDGLAEDVTTTTHQFGVYLTLSDESLLLLMISHVTSSDLKRRRLNVRSLGRDFAATEQDMLYFREHQRDQWRFDKSKHFAEAAALVIAAMLGCALVKTTVGTPI